MVDLPADLYKPAATILFGALCAALGVIGYFLRDLRQSVKDKLDDQDEKIEAVEKDVTKLKETLPQKYVLRDDFIRAIAGLENKIDNIGKEISDINKGLNRLIGGVKE
jgi:chromosome segregation ATPase